MRTVLINGTEVECKVSWDDLTVADFQRIYSKWKDDLEKEIEDRDYFKLFCIVNNLSATDFIRSRTNEEAITALISWALVPYSFSIEVPKHFTILGNKVEIPKSFGSLSIGQNIVAFQLLRKIEYKQEAIGDITAIAVQPLIDGRYNSERMKLVRDEIMKMKIKDIYGLGFFLFARVTRAGHEQWMNSNPMFASPIMRPVRMLLLWLGLTGYKDSAVYHSWVNTPKDLAWIRTMYSTGVASVRLSSLQ